MKMVRKQGGLIVPCSAGENVVEKCLKRIKEVEPDSLADKLLHITIKTDPYKKFMMDGFEFTTDGLGNFSSLCIPNMVTPEIKSLYFKDDLEEVVLCFVY